MKILFLDMDGVINSEESFLKNHEACCEHQHKNGGVEFAKEFCFPMGHISPPLVERLNKIVEGTNCFIVISSSWRVVRTPQEISGYLTQKGFKYGNNIIDRTDQNSKDARGGEIQDWLDKHPEVTSYVVIDDDSFDIIGDKTAKKHPNNFVHTDFKYGLQDEHVTQAINILNTI